MPQYVVIEGNIGAGKTTLVNKIAKDFDFKTIFEEFEDNPFLADFYIDNKTFAFKTEVYFLLTRIKQIKRDLQKIKKQNIIADYHITKSLIFAEQTLDKKEFELYKSLFNEITDFVPMPDKYVFLKQNIRNLISNIIKRGRDYEQSIEIDYLRRINESYLKFLKKLHKTEIIIVDISNFDFKNNSEDYKKILEQINLIK